MDHTSSGSILEERNGLTACIMPDTFTSGRRYTSFDCDWSSDVCSSDLSTAGARFFTAFRIELPTLRSTRRHSCRLCLDWTERRPHIAGALGAALTKRYFDLGWMERMRRSHAVIVTPLGRRGLQETFRLHAPEPGDPRKPQP